jgi:hypothetical protein
MTQIQESAPFPNHQFDFADVVLVIPLQEHGIVIGILYRNPDWYYRIELRSKHETWWAEDQLTWVPPEDCPACPCP